MSEDHNPRAWNIRLAEDSDAEGLVALIGGVYAEYPNCILDVEREEPDLLAIKSAFAAKPGRFWVAECKREIVGCIGVVRHAEFGELKKLYVRRDQRRRGLASRLQELAERQSQLWHCARLVAWSDSRFVEAHHFYESHGFIRRPETRELHDLSDTIEFLFDKRLALQS